jgi:hypothetical protein
MNKSVKVKIDGKEYVVSFPNVGQTLEIESMKMALTANKYPEFALSGLRSNVFVADLTDAIATFFVLIPELRANLSVKSYSELDLLAGAKLVSAYMDDYYPFYQEIMKDIYKYQNKVKEPEVGKQSEATS